MDIYKALNYFNYQIPSCSQVVKYLGFSDSEIGLTYIFLQIPSDTWIHLTPHMMVEWFGVEIDDKFQLEKFQFDVMSEFDEEIDYKITKDKLYNVTGTCFKLMIMRTNYKANNYFHHKMLKLIKFTNDYMNELNHYDKVK